MGSEDSTSTDRGYYDDALRVGGVGVWQWDVASGEVSWSPNVEAMFGLSPGTFENTFDGYLARVHQDDRDALIGELDAVTRGARTRYAHRHRIRRPDAEIVWLEAVGEVARDEQARAVRLYGVVKVVTDRVAVEEERRRAMEALHSSESRYRTVVTLMAEGIVVVDADGIVRAHNPAAREILRLDDATLSGHSAWDPRWTLFDAEGAPIPPERLPVMRSFLHGETCQHELLGIQDADEEAPRWLLVSSTPISEWGGEPLRAALASFVDVTAQRRGERERERLVLALEEKNAELERFNYSVSHDLKSPLITIRSFAQLLAQDLAAGATERVARDLEHIETAALRMERLLEDLLQLSRAGRALAPTWLDAREVLEEALAQIAGTLTDREVSVAVRTPLPRVWADRTRLLSVLQNLIDNAVKYLGDQPAPKIEVGARDDGALYVADNGVGVHPRHHAQIFELFERLGSSVPGTGIGLALSRRVIEAHGGQLWLASSGIPGEGSTFLFTLPGPDDEDLSARG